MNDTSTAHRSSASGYELLDSGREGKLERFGNVVLHRPSPQSLWERRRPDRLWEDAAAVYHRSREGGGHWEERAPLPDSWTLDIDDMRLQLKATSFGHVGVFPEQRPFWRFIGERCAKAERPLKVLNLFAYTGGSSLAAARGGAEVTHCDASKGIVQWASENAETNPTPGNIRWIVDEATRYVARELRRERRYDAIVLDPPSFGRGPKGQVFKLERDLPDLLADCGRLLSDDASFVLLSAHTPGVGPLALANLLAGALGDRGGDPGFGEMSIPEQDGERLLPSGTWAAWSRDGRLPLSTAPRSGDFDIAPNPLPQARRDATTGSPTES